jgi:hypothetical protein
MTDYTNTAAPGGAMKDTSGKMRLDLINPVALAEIAAVRSFGATKYADWDWCKGRDWSDYYAAVLRHMLAWYAGEDNDLESGLPHLAHAATTLTFLLEFAHTGAGTDNRPSLTKPSAAKHTG